MVSSDLVFLLFKEDFTGNLIVFLINGSVFKHMNSGYG